LWTTRLVRPTYGVVQVLKVSGFFMLEENGVIRLLPLREGEHDLGLMCRLLWLRTRITSCKTSEVEIC
jgi:hypothetical protein